jgi:uncharacterized membrane protein (UPF0127 family)
VGNPTLSVAFQAMGPRGLGAPYGHVLAEVVDGIGETGERGLLGRTSLAIGRGMLFRFDTPGRYPFTMRGMAFALDLVFVSERCEVVGVIRDAKPGDDTLTVEADYTMVLEVPARFSRMYDIRPGDYMRVW